jgi:hypothetical protein
MVQGVIILNILQTDELRWVLFIVSATKDAGVPSLWKAVDLDLDSTCKQLDLSIQGLFRMERTTAAPIKVSFPIQLWWG